MIYLTGVKNKDYFQIHHIGDKQIVEKTYNALKNGANSSGLDPQTVFIYNYPHDKQAIKDLIKVDFTEWCKINNINLS